MTYTKDQIKAVLDLVNHLEFSGENYYNINSNYSKHLRNILNFRDVFELRVRIAYILKLHEDLFSIYGFSVNGNNVYYKETPVSFI